MLRRRRRQAPPGFSVVELLVATTLGLWVLAGVIQSSLELIRLQRQWLTQARMQQDLRHADELFRRELRRSGRQQSAEQAVWPLGSRAGAENPWTALWLSPDARTLLYSHESDEGRGHHGWRQNARTRALDLRLQGDTLMPSAEDPWQSIQDTRLWEASNIRFSTEVDTASLLDACPSPVCTPADGQCPPSWTRRHAGASGQFVGAAPNGMTLNWSASVRARNMALEGRCPPER